MNAKVGLKTTFVCRNMISGYGAAGNISLTQFDNKLFRGRKSCWHRFKAAYIGKFTSIYIASGM